ncbi:6459_t:CDS:2, partial [Entrophospora sp. SA101]
WENQVTSSCDDRITQSLHEDYYMYKFTPSYEKLEISENGVRQLNMVFTTNTPVNINESEIIKMQFLDEELLRIGEQNPEENHLQDLINSTKYVNTYALDANRHIRFSLTRVERSYSTRNWPSYLGFGSEQIILPLITTSKFLDYPLKPDTTTNDTKILSIGLFALTNLVQQEQEVKDDTVGGWIGSIGGLIGLMLTMFTVLFGTKILAPFGIVQKFCCFSRTKGKFVRLPIIPLVKSTQREKVRIEDQVKYLTYRLHALETILSDYVISSDMIQALTVDAKKMEEPKPYNHVTEENQINLLSPAKVMA